MPVYPESSSHTTSAANGKKTSRPGLTATPLFPPSSCLTSNTGKSSSPSFISLGTGVSASFCSISHSRSGLGERTANGLRVVGLNPPAWQPGLGRVVQTLDVASSTTTGTRQIGGNYSAFIESHPYFVLCPSNLSPQVPFLKRTSGGRLLGVNPSERSQR